MKIIKSLLMLATLVLIIGCSPHPGAGKWKADNSNSLGIKNLSILFEGKSEFTSIEDKSIDPEEYTPCPYLNPL